MRFKRRNLLFPLALIMLFNFSITCYAEEVIYGENMQVIDEEAVPYIQSWTYIRTTSGMVVIPAGTYVPGASSYYVRLLQTTLNTLGYNCGTADGICGTNTQNAIKSFQRSEGLAVDGIAGEDTWREASDRLYQDGKYVPW